MGETIHVRNRKYEGLRNKRGSRKNGLQYSDSQKAVKGKAIKRKAPGKQVGSDRKKHSGIL